MTDDQLQYRWVFVRDFDRALRLYTETLGLSSTLAYEGWAQFNTGTCSLAIERVEPDDDVAILQSQLGPGQTLEGRFVACSLRVADIDATYRELLACMPLGGVLAHFKDPDGNILTLLGA